MHLSCAVHAHCIYESPELLRDNQAAFVVGENQPLAALCGINGDCGAPSRS